MPASGRRELVDLGGQYEIALGKAVDLVRVYLYADLVPGQIYLGVMALPLGQRTDAIDKRQCLGEILELECLYIIP